MMSQASHLTSRVAKSLLFFLTALAVTTLISGLSITKAQASYAPTWSQPAASHLGWKYSQDSRQGQGPTLQFHPSGSRSIAFGNGIFVAVSDSYDNSQSEAAVETSADGNSWTPQQADTSTTWTSVAFGGGIFVAVGHDVNWTTGMAMYSTDGVHWDSATLPDTQTTFNSVTYGGGTFVAVGYLNDLSQPGEITLYSDNGIDWHLGTDTTDLPWIHGVSLESVTYGAGKFVALGRTTSTYSQNELISTDGGRTWESHVASSDQDWQVTFGKGLFVAVNQWGIMTSPDGISWSFSQNNHNGNDGWFNITYVAEKEKFIISGSDNNQRSLLAVSDNGIDWVYQHVTYDTGLRGGAFGNNVFVMLDRNGVKYLSSLVSSVPSYELNLTSISFPSGQPLSSMCDSCLIAFQVQYSRSDGGIFDLTNAPTVHVTASGAAVTVSGQSSGGSDEIMYSGTAYYQAQGPADGLSIGNTFTIHASLISDPTQQGTLSLLIDANDHAPTISSFSGTGGEFVHVSPANQASPDSWSFTLTSNSSNNPSLQCSNIDNTNPILIYPPGGAPYSLQLFPFFNESQVNMWRQQGGRVWGAYVSSDQNGIPQEVFLPGLVDGCSYDLAVADSRQGFDSVPATGTFLYASTTFSAPVINSPTSGTIINGHVGAALSASISFTASQTPAFVSITNGSLPVGVSLNSVTGAISGTPTSTGTFATTFQVTDAVGETVTVQISFNISSGSQNSLPPTAAVSAPDPAQQSKILVTPRVITSSDAGIIVLIQGHLIEKIASIQINGAPISRGSWVQTSDGVTFTLPINTAGSLSIQLFNGAVPVLPAQNLVVNKAVLSTTSAPPVVDTQTTISTASSTTATIAKPSTPTESTKPSKGKTSVPTKLPVSKTSLLKPGEKVVNITCVKGREMRIVHGVNPKCPKGYDTKK